MIDHQNVFGGIMRRIYLLIFASLFSFSVLAHHSVKEVTANNKIVITKDFNQTVSGDKVRTYRINYKKLGFDEQLIEEHQLPKIGDKLKIYRTSFKFRDSKEKIFKSSEKELIGTATVIASDLTGESRSVAIFSDKKKSKAEFKNTPYSQEEIESLKTTAIVAIPDNGIQVNHSDTVEF